MKLSFSLALISLFVLVPLAFSESVTDNGTTYLEGSNGDYYGSDGSVYMGGQNSDGSSNGDYYGSDGTTYMGGANGNDYGSNGSVQLAPNSFGGSDGGSYSGSGNSGYYGGDGSGDGGGYGDSGSYGNNGLVGDGGDGDSNVVPPYVFSVGDTVLVNANANLYTGSTVVDHVTSGQAFTIAEINAPWVSLKTSDGTLSKGWLNSNDLTESAVSFGEKVKVIEDASVYDKTKVVDQVTAGQIFTVDQIQSVWATLKAADGTLSKGWVKADNLRQYPRASKENPLASFPTAAAFVSQLQGTWKTNCQRIDGQAVWVTITIQGNSMTFDDRSSWGCDEGPGMDSTYRETYVVGDAVGTSGARSWQATVQSLIGTPLTVTEADIMNKQSLYGLNNWVANQGQYLTPTAAASSDEVGIGTDGNLYFGISSSDASKNFRTVYHKQSSTAR